jgi:HEAT repeat protein
MVRGVMAKGAGAGLAALVLAFSVLASGGRGDDGPEKSLLQLNRRWQGTGADVDPGSDEPDRESLRYAGKTFQQWRKELQTELKPEFRAEAIKAMGFFGAAGYGAEAARAVIESMRGCGVVFTARGMEAGIAQEDMMLIGAACQAIHRIGPEVVPALRAGLGHPNRAVRQFAISCVAHSGEAARCFRAEIVRAIDDSDPFVAQQACMIAVASCPGEEGLACALARALRSRDDLTRVRAAEALGQLGKAGHPALDGLLEALEDSVPGVRAASILALSKLEVDPKQIVQPLLRATKADKEGGAVVQAAHLYFTGQGTGADGIVRALALVVKENEELRDQALLALRAMGPAAKGAVPVLKEALKNATGEQADRLEASVRAIEAGSSAPSYFPSGGPPYYPTGMSPSYFPSGAANSVAPPPALTPAPLPRSPQSR